MSAKVSYLIEADQIPMDEEVTYCSTWAGVINHANWVRLNESEEGGESEFTMDNEPSTVRMWLQGKGYIVHDIVMVA